MPKRIVLIAMSILSLAFISTLTLASDIPGNREAPKAFISTPTLASSTPTLASDIPGYREAPKDLRITEDMPEVKMYAERYNVDLSEAARRLNLQSSVDDYYKQLQEKHAKTFAGLYFVHEPNFRIMVQFANGIPADATRDVPDSARKDIEHREVRFSLAELKVAQKEVMELLEFPSSINLSKNAVEIYASSRSQRSLDAGNALLASMSPSLAEKITITDPIFVDELEPEVREISGSDDPDLKDQASIDEFPSAVNINP